MRRVAVWTPSVLVMAAIFFLSSLPDTGGPPVGFSDKLLHVLVYAALGGALLFGLADGRPRSATAGAAALAMIFGTLYGISDELHQSLVPLRTVELGDLVADAIGSAMGAASLFAGARLRSRRRKTDG